MANFLSKTNWIIPWWGYWLFFLSTGFCILVFEDDYKDQDAYAIAVLGYFFVLFLTVARWIFGQVREVINLRNEKARTELIHLQSQVNPHFFFNILNNLYGWVEKDPKQAQKMILKLSEMMRYSIYDGQKNEVTLGEEIAYLKHYIELHQMRYRKKIEISLQLEVAEESLRLKPLLFIILLENAFKHGVENLREGAFIHIFIAASREELQFTIENNFEQPAEDSPNGIGLKNLRRRLELVYPKRHALVLSSTENIFKAALTLSL